MCSCTPRRSQWWWSRSSSVLSCRKERRLSVLLSSRLYRRTGSGWSRHVERTRSSWVGIRRHRFGHPYSDTCQDGTWKESSTLTNAVRPHLVTTSLAHLLLLQLQVSPLCMATGHWTLREFLEEYRQSVHHLERCLCVRFTQDSHWFGQVFPHL